MKKSPDMVAALSLSPTLKTSLVSSGAEGISLVPNVLSGGGVLGPLLGCSDRSRVGRSIFFAFTLFGMLTTGTNLFARVLPHVGHPMLNDASSTIGDAPLVFSGESLLKIKKHGQPRPPALISQAGAVPLHGSPLLKPTLLVGTWRLESYQMLVDGRSVEVPLSYDPLGAKKSRETWVFRADGNFTHRLSDTVWFSGRWRLAKRAVVSERYRPEKKLEIVHLVTEKVMTSMMTQRSVEHHLVAITPSGHLVTWYSGQKMPRMSVFRQGHRFVMVLGGAGIHEPSK